MSKIIIDTAERLRRAEADAIDNILEGGYHDDASHSVIHSRHLARAIERTFRDGMLAAVRWHEEGAAASEAGWRKADSRDWNDLRITARNHRDSAWALRELSEDATR